MTDEDVHYGLADTIRAIRRELTQARTEASNEDMRFRVGPVELELALEVSGRSELGGGVRVWVVSADARRASSESELHRIHLTLYPEDVRGEDINIHGTVPS